MTALVVLVCFLFPEAALAHSAVPGMDGFYRGLAHPILEIVQTLVIVATGLFIGCQTLEAIQSACRAFVIAFALGLGSAATFERAVAPDIALFALALLAAIGVAAARHVPQFVSVLLASIVGVGIGIRSMPDDGPWPAVAFTVSGTVIGVNLLMLYAIGAAHLIGRQDHRPWLQIGLRIVGSWIVAACALMLALAART